MEDYARKNGFTNVRHFTDDGVRGTTFKRPGLDAMVDEIRAGNVATVIVKDQSRIGRDVVEVGLLNPYKWDTNAKWYTAGGANWPISRGEKWYTLLSVYRR